MDWALAFAAVGARRLQRLHARARRPGTTSPADPDYYVEPASDLRCARHRRHVPPGPRSTTRASASCGSASTPSSASASPSSSSSASRRAARGAPSNSPSSAFQPSELGKLLLVLALAGFVIDGARRGSPRQRTVRYLCLGLAPAALVFLQPDLGTSLVFGAITLAVMYVGGVPWTHFAVIGAALVAFDSTGPRGGARSRDAGPEGLPGSRGSPRSCTPARTPATRATSRIKPRSPSDPGRRPAVAIGPPRRGSTSSRSGTPTSSSR